MVVQFRNLAAYYKLKIILLIIMKQFLNPFLKIYFDLLSFDSVTKLFHNCDPLTFLRIYHNLYSVFIGRY